VTAQATARGLTKITKTTKNTKPICFLLVSFVSLVVFVNP